MNKALHDYILIIKDEKKPIRYDRDSVEFLIDGANCYLKEGENGPKNKVALSKSIYNLLTEYEKNGASLQLVSELNKFLKPVKHQSFIERIDGKLATVYIAHLEHHPDPAVFACYLFSSMSTLGWLEGLKRCQSKDCQQFFIGRSNVKWCSKTCGSRARVKKMRRKNKY